MSAPLLPETTLPPPVLRGRTREVLVLAWPVVVSTVSLSLMLAADTYFAGRLGTTEQGAVGFCGTLLWAFYAFFMGTLEIVQTFVAQHTGANQPDRAARYGTAGLHAAVACSLLLAPLALVGGPMFETLGIAADMVPAATTYWTIRILGTGPVFLSRVQECYFRGIGDTITPMVVALVANALNVILDAAFVLGFAPLGIPPLGVAGLAWATVIATAAQWILLGLASEMRRIRGLPAPLHFRRSSLADARDLFRVGAPAGLHWMFDITAWTLFTLGIARLDSAQAATNVIAITLIRTSFMPGFAVGTAAQTLVGQYLGAKDPASAARAGWTSLRIAGVYMGALGAVFFVFGGELFGLFTGDAGVRGLGASVMRWAALFQLGDAIQVVLGSALRGAGDTRYVMWVATAAAWLVFVPLAWLLVVRLGMGVEGGWLACVVWVAALSVPLVFRFRSDAWRRSLLVQEAAVPAPMHPETEVA